MDQLCSKCSKMVSSMNFILHDLSCDGKEVYQKGWGQQSDTDVNVSCSFCGEQYPTYLIDEHLQVCTFKDDLHFDQLQEGEEIVQEEFLSNGDIKQVILKKLKNNKVERIEKVIPQDNQPKNIETKQECSICYLPLDDKTNIEVLECMHQFHIICINIWLRQNKKCPICKHNCSLQSFL